MYSMSGYLVQIHFPCTIILLSTATDRLLCGSWLTSGGGHIYLHFEPPAVIACLCCPDSEKRRGIDGWGRVWDGGWQRRVHRRVFLSPYDDNIWWSASYSLWRLSSPRLPPSLFRAAQNAASVGWRETATKAESGRRQAVSWHPKLTTWDDEIWDNVSWCTFSSGWRQGPVMLWRHVLLFVLTSKFCVVFISIRPHTSTLLTGSLLTHLSDLFSVKRVPRRITRLCFCEVGGNQWQVWKAFFKL